MFIDIDDIVIASLSQLIWTMHNICKIRGSNLRHKKKKISMTLYGLHSITKDYIKYSFNRIINQFEHRVKQLKV